MAGKDEAQVEAELTKAGLSGEALAALQLALPCKILALEDDDDMFLDLDSTLTFRIYFNTSERLQVIIYLYTDEK